MNSLLDELRTYWPLTLRQVYYQLVAAGDIENNRREYQKLSRLLTGGRYAGDVSWDAIEDRSRTTLASNGWGDVSDFIDDELDGLLAGYRRDLLQGQCARPEIWVEKDALSRICHDVASDYCVPVVVASGFSSTSYIHECRNRILDNASRDQRTSILFFADHDPSGWAMLQAIMKRLDDMGLAGLADGHRCALTPEQIELYGLPQSLDALKRDTDSRAPKFIERFGEVAVELDALPPPTLENIVRESIENCLDMDLFDEERAQEAAERREVAALRERVLRAAADER